MCPNSVEAYQSGLVAPSIVRGATRLLAARQAAHRPYPLNPGLTD
jgi:hypothetical protein